jgi:hypothetical protein
MSCHRDSTVEGNNPDREIPVFTFEKLQDRQERFVETIIGRPLLGTFVLSLTWTYNWYPYREVEYHEEKPDPGQEKMWKAFQLMKGVKSLDMCSINVERELLIPPPLFPKATSIRIGGLMSYAFVRSMISSPATVRFLDLDNVQGLAQLVDGKHLERAGISNELQNQMLPTATQKFGTPAP